MKNLMSRLIIAVVISSLTFACSSSQAISENISSQKNETIKAKTEKSPAPIKVFPNIKLKNEAAKELDKSLPPDVRAVLENADEFEILAEAEKKEGKLVYPITEGFNLNPNLKAKILQADLRKEILEYFYRDVAKGSEPANCWQPHHILRAKSGDKTAEIKICFSCSRFEGESSFGKFSGTTGRGDEKTENLFNRLIETYGVETQ